MKVSVEEWQEFPSECFWGVALRRTVIEDESIFPTPQAFCLQNHSIRFKVYVIYWTTVLYG